MSFGKGNKDGAKWREGKEKKGGNVQLGLVNQRQKSGLWEETMTISNVRELLILSILILMEKESKNQSIPTARG